MWIGRKEPASESITTIASWKTHQPSWRTANYHSRDLVLMRKWLLNWPVRVLNTREPATTRVRCRVTLILGMFRFKFKNSRCLQWVTTTTRDRMWVRKENTKSSQKRMQRDTESYWKRQARAVRMTARTRTATWNSTTGARLNSSRKCGKQSEGAMARRTSTFRSGRDSPSTKSLSELRDCCPQRPSS